MRWMRNIPLHSSSWTTAVKNRYVIPNGVRRALQQRSWSICSMARKACEYYVYLLASRSGTLYVGVTNDLVRRVWQHKQVTNDGFTKRYRIDRLVRAESGGDVLGAIAREKQVRPGEGTRKLLCA